MDGDNGSEYAIKVLARLPKIGWNNYRIGSIIANKGLMPLKYKRLLRQTSVKPCQNIEMSPISQEFSSKGVAHEASNEVRRNSFGPYLSGRLYPGEHCSEAEAGRQWYG